MEKPLDLPKLLRTIRDLLAEPAEARLARMAGKRAEFHYLPPTGRQPVAKARGETPWLVRKNCCPSWTCVPAGLR